MHETEERKSFWEEIFSEEPVRMGESGPIPQPRPFPEKPGARRRKPPIGRPQVAFEVTGHPVYNIKWDDLGLGLMPQMGYMPGRTVRIEAREGKWVITGARVNSTMLLFLALGAGGAFHFLQDVLSQMKNWGEVLGALVIFVPTILNLVIRVRSVELYPFELDFIGYDPETHIMVLSTVTEPGGVVALKVDLPSDDAQRKAEEERLIANLRRSHTGFMLIRGAAVKADTSVIKQWALWTFVWAVLTGFVIYLTFYVTS